MEKTTSTAVETGPAICPQPWTDPWKDRSKHMRCATCSFYAEKMRDVGRCRRHAPTRNGFPVVYSHEDWCGDHRLDHDKLEVLNDL